MSRPDSVCARVKMAFESPEAKLLPCSVVVEVGRVHGGCT